MSDFAVYSYDTVEAHNLLALQAENDVFTDTYQLVVARVRVESAHWREEYKGPLHPHEPYLEIIGEARSIFIEEDDSRIFPCGSKNLVLMTPYPVRYHYVLSIDEKVDIYGMGYGYDGFDVPANLISNEIELPLNIKYYGVYESPIAVIEILHPGEIFTCTRENNYYGIFNGCPVSPAVEAQKQINYEFYPHTDFEVEPEPIYAEEVEQQVEEEVEQTVEQQMEVAEDQANLSAVEELIKQQTSEAATRRANVASHAKDRQAILARVNEMLNKRAEEYSRARETSLSDAIFGAEGSEDKREMQEVKATYEDFKAAAEAVDAEHLKSEKDADESRENARKVDRAIDNQLLNAGVDDIAGYNPDAQTLSSQTLSDSALTPEQKKEIADKKSGKAQIEAARRQDIAADNKALNEGITDIAGQGVTKPVHEKAVRTAADLIAGLDTDTQKKPVTPQDEGSQFL